MFLLSVPFLLFTGAAHSKLTMLCFCYHANVHEDPSPQGRIILFLCLFLFLILVLLTNVYDWLYMCFNRAPDPAQTINILKRIFETDLEPNMFM